MKNLIWILLGGMLLFSCAGGKSTSKMSHRKSSNANMVTSGSQAKNVKVKTSYKRNRYHQSQKYAVKTNDVTVDKSLANALKVKKANKINSEKYKKSQNAYLQRLNANGGRNSKKNMGYFSFY
ncbi:MAG TPA: hypothetical protein VIK89_03085 [Cytophagaceae bacterium]